MHEQDNEQLQTLKMNESELLEKRKKAIVELIEEMTKSLPPMVQTMLIMYRSTVFQFVDALSFEQTEDLIEKVQDIIDRIRG